MTSPCTVIQEQMVCGERLGEIEQTHVLGCAGCSRLAAECLALDGMVADGLEGAVSVPDDFADQVMRNLDAEVQICTRWEALLGRRWVQIALANLGIGFAVVNLFRFVFSALIPTASLGGLP
jgi:hypothetical protein